MRAQCIFPGTYYRDGSVAFIFQARERLCYYESDKDKSLVDLFKEPYEEAYNIVMGNHDDSLTVISDEEPASYHVKVEAELINLLYQQTRTVLLGLIATASDQYRR